MNHADHLEVPPSLQIESWCDLVDLQHGFCGREGGISTGAYARLNLSYRVGDDAAVVGENWRRVQAGCGPDLDFVQLRQVHGDAVVVAEEVGAAEPEADAVVTRARGYGLGILTADCVPLLMVDPRTRAIAAVHAGWRGSAAGIAARTVRHLQDRYGTVPHELRVALGPAVAACCYEVSHEVAAAIEAGGVQVGDAVRRYARDRPRVDLRCVNEAQLQAVGVRDIERIGPCTRCAHERFFSHRQATSQGDGITGRQLSFLGWRPGCS